jgi:hypothetical protein
MDRTPGVSDRRGVMAHFIAKGQPTSLVELSVGEQADIQLWGTGPNGEALDVTSTKPAVVRVEEVQATFGPQIRGFKVRGVGKGSARLQGRIGAGGLLWADTRVLVGIDAYSRFYHGTNSATADLLMGFDLSPKLISSLVVHFDWSDYTDFGKGFYVHYEANMAMAYEWAKREYKTDWAVVEVIATPDELQDLEPNKLVFQNKTDRPSNSPRPIVVTTTARSFSYCPVPQLLPCIKATYKSTNAGPRGDTMNWLEFVEHNRHIVRGGMLIARPNDNDWSTYYSYLRGPLWVPRDSGYSVGLPKFPDSIHQLNWGQAGLDMLNTVDAKPRRFKFSQDNAGLFPPPA